MKDELQYFIVSRQLALLASDKILGIIVMLQYHALRGSPGDVRESHRILALNVHTNVIPPELELQQFYTDKVLSKWSDFSC